MEIAFQSCIGVGMHDGGAGSGGGGAEEVGRGDRSPRLPGGNDVDNEGKVGVVAGPEVVTPDCSRASGAPEKTGAVLGIEIFFRYG